MISQHKCHPCGMTEVGLRELRQDASELVRRTEAGEEITITVSGRPAARLVPVRPARWRTWSEVADLFAGKGDPEWERTCDLVDDAVRNPWAEG